jgi:hypothetical protein
MGLLTGIICNKAEKNDYDGTNFTENDMLGLVERLPGLQLWEMHEEDNGVIGQVISAAIDGEKRIKVMVNVDEETERGRETMKKVRNGTYKGFSCGTENKIVDYMKPTMRIVGKDVKELSVVDNPDAPGALIEFFQSEEDKKNVKDYIFDSDGKLRKDASKILIQKVPKKSINPEIEKLFRMGNTIKSGSENAKYKLFESPQKRALPKLELETRKEVKMSAPAQPAMSDPIPPQQQQQQPPKPEISDSEKFRHLLEKTGMTMEELTSYAIERKTEEEKNRAELKTRFLQTVEELLKENGKDPNQSEFYNGLKSANPNDLREHESFMMVATQASAASKKRQSEMEAEYQKMKAEIAELKKKEQDIEKDKRLTEEVNTMINKRKATDFSAFGFKLPKYDNQAQSKPTEDTTKTVSTIAGAFTPSQPAPQTQHNESAHQQSGQMDGWKRSQYGVPIQVNSVRETFQGFDEMQRSMRTISSADFQQFKKKPVQTGFRFN